MLLRPKKEARGPLGAFFRWFNRVFGRATDGYVSACHHLIRKSGFAFLLLGLIVVAAGFFGKKIPGSFLPDEDQGYVYAGLQLPDAASLQRSSEAARQVEKIILDTPGVQYVSSVMGYSMLSGVNPLTALSSLSRLNRGRTARHLSLAIKVSRPTCESSLPGFFRLSFLLSASRNSRCGNFRRRDLHPRRPVRQRHRLSG